MAPRSTSYRTLAKVIDAAKKAGAGPIKFVSNAEEVQRARRQLTSAHTTDSPGMPEQPGDLPAGMLDPSDDPRILKESSLVVVIAADNSLYIRNSPVPLVELEATIRSLTAEQPEAERVVYIRSHLDTPYGLVVEVIETIRRAGVSQIGLVAEKRAPK